MRGSWLVLGVLIGLGVGWWAFQDEPAAPVTRLGDEPPPAGAPLPSGPAPAPTLDGRANGVTRPRAAPAPTPKPLTAARRQIIVEGSHAAAVAHVQQHGYLNPVVEALIQRARRLHAAGARRPFLQALRLLHETGNPRAHAYFVELLVLAPPEWPQRFEDQGTMMLTYLHGAEVAGIAAAARRRIEVHGIGPGRPLPPAWRRLVLQHGDAADRQWLAALDGGVQRILAIEVADPELAVARRALDEATEAYRAGRLGRQPSLLFGILRTFAHSHPTSGRPLIAEALQSGKFQGAPVKHGEAGILALCYLQKGTDAEAAAKVFARISDPTMRFEAYRALLFGDRLPPDGAAYRGAVEDAVRYLEREAGGEGVVLIEERDDVNMALALIATARHATTQRAVTVFEQVAARLEGLSAEHWQTEAKKLRTRLEGRWR